MAGYEYRTTFEQWTDQRIPADMPDPHEPEGSAWEMVGSAATVDPKGGSGYFFWFWRRWVP